jgi:signal transduction histidine kinase
VNEIRITAYESGSGLMIIWEDNGTGVSMDDKERIFEREFGKNTGIGLFLAREILSLTGISIKETGVFGTGARFEIFVPKGGWRKIVE